MRSFKKKEAELDIGNVLRQRQEPYGIWVRALFPSQPSCPPRDRKYVGRCTLPRVFFFVCLCVADSTFRCMEFCFVNERVPEQTSRKIIFLCRVYDPACYFLFSPSMFSKSKMGSLNCHAQI